MKTHFVFIAFVVLAMQPVKVVSRMTYYAVCIVWDVNLHFETLNCALLTYSVTCPLVVSLIVKVLAYQAPLLFCQQ